MTESPTSAGPPPGWYADSPRAPRLRWWTGSEWTDHFQETTPLPVMADPPPAVLESTEPPKSRAARRAAQSTESTQPPPPQVVFAAKPEPAPEPEPVEPVPAPKPDMVLDRSLRTIDDRMPQPIVYRPTTAVPAHTGPQRSTFVPVSRNSYATASLVLSVLGLGGFGVAYFWLRGVATQADQTVSIISGCVVVIALALAVSALVVAVHRPTRKSWAVCSFGIAIVATVVAGLEVLSKVIGG